MTWALLLSFAMIAGDPVAPPAKPAVKSADARKTKPSPKLITASMPSLSEDYEAESELLRLANESRQEAGLPPMHMAQNLTEAARAHARLMVDRQQLSHQFDTEVGLGQRLLIVGVRFDHAGENVAYNFSADKAAEAFMQSPPHRDNLLDPNFDEAGIAAFWSNGRLYVVEDFAHPVPETPVRLR